MEKEVFMNEGTQPTWNVCTFGLDIQPTDLNSATGQVPNCVFNPNWENSMDHSDPFESALSSMVSSPVASNAAGSSDDVREVIARLGNLGSFGEISPNSCIKTNSTNNSSYSTPLSSPRKLNLSVVDSQIRGNLALFGNELTSLAPLSADPGFAERAARFSCFGTTELPQRLVPTPRMESGMHSRVTSTQSINVAGSHQSNKNSLQKGNSGWSENAEFGDSKEVSSVSVQIPGGGSITKGNNGTNAKKRKSTARGKAKQTPSPSASDAKVAAESDESTAKRNKQDEVAAAGNAKENGENQKQAKENPKRPEPPKDYIHVRARRGQATDSHSLAERVRRERISERMKFLQDLVPGCNKVIGKAVMLDEIINYVQSLQHQVEFLSMKLATVNPRMDFNMDALLSKDIFQSAGPLPHTLYPVDSSAPAFPLGYQPQQGLTLLGGIPNNMERQFSMNQLNPSLHQNSSMQLTSMDGICDTAPPPQVPSLCEDDLQSVVQMGFGQNQQQNFHGSMTARQVKNEL